MSSKHRRVGDRRLEVCWNTAAHFQIESEEQTPIGNWQLEIGNVLMGYQTSGSAQRRPGEPRQAGNGATVARSACVAGKSGV